MTPRAPTAIDCDIHCAVPSKEVLLPHLEEHWREFMNLARSRRSHANIDLTYPAWSKAFATDGNALTLAKIQKDVLERAQLAILYCYYGVEGFTHPYLAAALTTAVNCWLKDEWLDRDDRLRAGASVTPQHVHFAVEEVVRISTDPRFVQIMVPARSPSGYGNQHYWPLWEAAAEHDLPVAITFGGAPSTPPSSVNWPGSFLESYATGFQAYHSHVVSLVMSGIFDRLPNLRFVLAESGWTWLPALLWRLDQEWKALSREVPWLREPPSSYFRKHFRVTTQPIDGPPESLAGKIDELGSSDMLLFGSDYPHESPVGIDDLLAEIPAEHADRVLRANALEWYAPRLEVLE